MNQKVIIVSHASPAHRGQVGNLIGYNAVVLKNGTHIHVSRHGLIDYNLMAGRMSKESFKQWIDRKKIQHKNFKYPRKKETTHPNWDQKSMSILVLGAQ